jgi:2-keto-4-pentenoate hydratase/2-oxohepta-3-ene-1,7-dioic acid hydratase in catechol pathway
MKLLRYGPAGQERPGLLDGDGRIRDLSDHVPDIDQDCLTPAGLAALARLDPQGLGMWLDVNGRRMQTGNTKSMIFGVAEIVSDLSGFLTGLPGDIVTTGTPPEVGMGKKPQPTFLKMGDVLAPGIDGFGEQQQEVASWRRVVEV